MALMGLMMLVALAAAAVETGPTGPLQCEKVSDPQVAAFHSAASEYWPGSRELR